MQTPKPAALAGGDLQSWQAAVPLPPTSGPLLGAAADTAGRQHAQQNCVTSLGLSVSAAGVRDMSALLQPLEPQQPLPGFKPQPLLMRSQKLPRLVGDSCTSSWKQQQPQWWPMGQGMLAQQPEPSSGSVQAVGPDAHSNGTAADTLKPPLAVLQGWPLHCSSSSHRQHGGLPYMSPQVPAWQDMQSQPPPRPPQLLQQQQPQISSRQQPPLQPQLQPLLQPQQPHVRQQALPPPQVPLQQGLSCSSGGFSGPSFSSGKGGASSRQQKQQQQSFLQQQGAVPAPHPAPLLKGNNSSQPSILTVQQLSAGIRLLDQLQAEEQQQQQVQGGHYWQSRRDILNGLALLGRCGIWPVQQLPGHNQLLQQALHSQQQQQQLLQGYIDSACQRLPQAVTQQQQQQYGQQYVQPDQQQQSQQQVDCLDELLLLQAVHVELNLLNPQQARMLDELTASLLQHERTELQPKGQRLLHDLASDMLQQQLQQQKKKEQQPAEQQQQQQRRDVWQQQQQQELASKHVQLLSQLVGHSAVQPQACFLPHHQHISRTLSQQLQLQDPNLQREHSHQQQHPHSQSLSTDGQQLGKGRCEGSVAYKGMPQQQTPLMLQQQQQDSPTDSADEAAAAAGEGAVRYTGVYPVRRGSHKRKAQISLGQLAYLATCDSAEEAARKWNAAARFKDPDKPVAELNPVEPLFPPDHVVGELHGVTENSKDIFINWASNNDKRAIVAVQTGSNEYSLTWS